jgi:hypothetical protein
VGLNISGIEDQQGNWQFISSPVGIGPMNVANGGMVGGVSRENETEVMTLSPNFAIPNPTVCDRVVKWYVEHSSCKDETFLIGLYSITQRYYN